MAICEKCKREFEGDSSICPVCQEQSEKLEDRKLSPKRFILIFCDFALIAICLLVFLVPTFTDESRNLSGKFELNAYVQDNILYCKNLGDEKSEPVVLYEGISGEYGVSTVCDETTYSADGTVIYFPTALPENALSYTLCCYDFKTNGPVKEIAKNVCEYTVSADGLRVFYLENDSSDLYVNDGTQSTRLAENVFTYEASDDGAKLVYTDNENKLYLKNGENDAVLLSENGSVEQITNNFSAVCFTHSDKEMSKLSLKKADFEGKITDIAENIQSEPMVYPSGEVYYCTLNEEAESLYYYNGIESQLVEKGVHAESIAYAGNTASTVYTLGDKVFHATGASEKIDLGSSEQLFNCSLSGNGTHVYFTSGAEKLTDIYEIRLAEGTEPKLISEKAEASSYVIGSDNRVLYYKENGEKKDIYIGETKVAEKIDEAYFSQDLAAGVIVSFDNSGEKAAISIYINGEVTLAAENVDSYECDLENGLTVYYTNAEGCFRYTSDGKTTLIASGKAEFIL
ncbi:MAG: hypothetical protein IJ491_03150 [Clostridia bacterium]|nr:hypothetical protein [Clostridia bacterium]